MDGRPFVSFALCRWPNMNRFQLLTGYLQAQRTGTAVLRVRIVSTVTKELNASTDESLISVNNMLGFKSVGKKSPLVDILLILALRSGLVLIFCSAMFF